MYVADQGCYSDFYLYGSYLDPELHCCLGLASLATNNKSSLPQYDLKQPLTINNVSGISIN